MKHLIALTLYIIGIGFLINISLKVMAACKLPTGDYYIYVGGYVALVLASLVSELD